MSSLPATDAIPDVTELLDRHAKWCAQMCRNVPSGAVRSCQNLPSPTGAPTAKQAQTRPNLPEPAGTCHVVENDGTNPTAYRAVARPLNDRQLAAALLMVRGHGSVAVARALGVNRHTVAVWKQNPAFVIEVQRLRAYLTASVVARPPARASHPVARPTPRRMTRQEIEQEDRDCEAVISQMLRGRTAATGV